MAALLQMCCLRSPAQVGCWRACCLGLLAAGPAWGVGVQRRCIRPQLAGIALPLSSTADPFANTTFLDPLQSPLQRA